MDVQMYTPRQVSQALALSRSTTYALLASGEIPSVKIGRCRRIPGAALDGYVADLLGTAGA